MIARLQHHPALDIDIACSGGTHRLHWWAGELTAPDHEDAEGERALAALGGPSCACVDALDAWARHIDDLLVLVLASRGPTDPVRGAEPPAGRSAGGTGWLYSARGWVGASGGMVFASGPVGTAGIPTRPAPEPGDDPAELIELMGSNGALSERLAVTTAAIWAERLRLPDGAAAARPALGAALHGRVASTLRWWLADPDLTVDVEMIGPDEPPHITAAGGRVGVRVPFDWLVDVWGRGAAVVMDRLALRLLAATSDEVRLLTVGRGLDDVRPVTTRIG